MAEIDAVKGQIRRVLANLMASPSLRKTVTYRKFTGQSAFDRSKGVPVETFDETTVTALELRHNQRSAMASSSASVEVGDLAYMFLAEDIPSGFSMKDRLVADGKEKKIKAIDPAIDLTILISVDGT
jgi:hypothetical protein